jgi:Fe-S oxidoreductase
MAVPPIRNSVAGVLGITPHRPFPKFSTKRAKLPVMARQRQCQKIIFLPDAFARYLEPETEQAALDILSNCNLEVYVLPILGAGASFLSKGFIEQARVHAEKVLDILKQVDPEYEATLVGIEPPEVYALKHDYMDLVPHRQREIDRRVDQIWLLDEFLLRSDEFNSLRIANTGRLGTAGDDSSAGRVSFHPHCHQRAQGPSADGLPNGTSATLELLRACGYDVQLMDTGCCGMAGTFGYEAEHYELSMKVGELKLFPAVRDAARENSALSERNSKNGARQMRIVSSGAACRMQIRQGTGVEAIHPIQLVAQQLREWNPDDRR